MQEIKLLIDLDGDNGVFIKYEKSEEAVIDRDAVRQLVKKAINQHISIIGVLTSQVETINGRLIAGEPFYTLEISQVKTKAGKIYHEQGRIELSS
ncbi:MAG TPA: hypothetical protein PLL67_06140 [Gammaproteobacteria bacterium]|nr:hypothetical protein [Gammaproteobacteria bacterium]